METNAVDGVKSTNLEQRPKDGEDDNGEEGDDHAAMKDARQLME